MAISNTLPAIGTVLSVPKSPVLHKGIMFPSGLVLHASKTKGKVVLERYDDFANGQPVKEEGYPGTLSVNSVIENGLKLLDRPYRLFSDNCEHLVTECHGLPKHSKQLFGWTVAILVGIFAWSQLKKA